MEFRAPLKLLYQIKKTDRYLDVLRDNFYAGKPKQGFETPNINKPHDSINAAGQFH